MIDLEELIFGIASTGVPAMLMLMTLGFIFDYIRYYLFHD